MLLLAALICVFSCSTKFDYNIKSELVFIEDAVTTSGLLLSFYRSPTDDFAYANDAVSESIVSINMSSKKIAQVWSFENEGPNAIKPKFNAV